MYVYVLWLQSLTVGSLRVTCITQQTVCTSKCADTWSNQQFILILWRTSEESLAQKTFGGTMATAGHAHFHHISEITSSLYLTSAYGASSPTALRAKGITCIINISLSFQTPTPKLRDIEFVRIAVDDIPTAQLGVHFDRIADKIYSVKKSGGKTLVHCYAGRSRSASSVMAYLMRYEHMTLKQAHTHVKTRRPVIRPNPGFWKQLITYEHRLYGKNSVKMMYTHAGAIPDVYAHELKNFVHL